MANHLIDVAKNVYQKRKEQLGQETVTAIENMPYWEQRINYGWSIWTCWMICGRDRIAGLRSERAVGGISKEATICLSRY